MTLSISKDTAHHTSDSDTLYISLFPASGLLDTTEQIRRFELLRLALFVLKLRKHEQRLENGPTGQMAGEASSEQKHEHQFRCSLLRHVIFQQVLTLIRLDAREQALQIIEACQK
jgi:hypothetical protein